MSRPNGKPPIDRSASVADVAPPAAAAAQDAPMPTVENDLGSVFQPASGIGAADVFEIALMFLLELSKSPAQVERGALRGIALSATRVDQLSDSARRFMQPLGQPVASN